jgi:rhodanese-related sulfurtransferase
MPELKMILRGARVAAIASVFLFRPSFLAAQDAGPGYRNLSPAEARESIAIRSGDPGFVLLDVRTPKEFDAERIEGAVMVDYLSPSFREEMAKFDRNKTYLVYCRTGNRTQGALKAMRELGFGNLFHLEGGITKWKEAGFPTAR